MKKSKGGIMVRKKDLKEKTKANTNKMGKWKECSSDCGKRVTLKT